MFVVYCGRQRKRPRGCANTPGPGPQRKDVTVDKRSLAHSTRTVRVNEQLLEEVSELTGIEYRVLYSAFAGEPKDLALDIVKTIVAENLEAAPEAWTERLRERAKAEGMGEYRPGYWEGYELTYEYNDFLRSIGRL